MMNVYKPYLKPWVFDPVQKPTVFKYGLQFQWHFKNPRNRTNDRGNPGNRSWKPWRP